MFFNIDKERELLHMEFEHKQAELRQNHQHHRDQLEKEYQIKRLNDKLSDESEIKRLNDKIVSLEADLKIERASRAKVEAEAKPQYAEHVMKVTDERVAEMREIYQNYAKQLTEVVKASHSGATTVNNTVKS